MASVAPMQKSVFVLLSRLALPRLIAAEADASVAEADPLTLQAVTHRDARLNSRLTKLFSLRSEVPRIGLERLREEEYLIEFGAHFGGEAEARTAPGTPASPWPA